MKVVKSTVSKLEDRFGRMFYKFVGPNHIFLGMKLKFKDKKVSIDTREFLTKAATYFGEKGLYSAVAPLKSDLKTMDLKSPISFEERRKKFYSIEMMIMHVFQRG